MILIAESGSTKTNWLSEDRQLYETIGFNPMFHDSNFVFEEMQKNEALKKRSSEFTQVFFYGASCSSEDRNEIVASALRRFFSKVELIQVDHDLMAAALATYSGQTGIACILGTGSNSCLYDGKELTEEVPALGYILGDEGSGAWFGKKLLALFLYHRLPEATDNLMRTKYALAKEKIFELVYRLPNPNRAMAAYTKVLSESPDKDFISSLVKEGFREFFTYHITCYPNHKIYPVHFVGSIAHVFRMELEAVAAEFDCQIGVVDQNPVYRLLDWHLKNPQPLPTGKKNL